MSSRSRFATPAQSLYHHCSPYRELHVRRESFACAPCGTVHTPSQHRPIVSRELRTLQRCNVNDAPYTKGSAMLSGLRTKAGVADQTKRDLCLVQGPFPVASFKGHFLPPRSRAISCRLVQGPFPVASFKGHFLSPPRQARIDRFATLSHRVGVVRRSRQTTEPTPSSIRTWLLTAGW
jgi:hypothetical protein